MSRLKALLILKSLVEEQGQTRTREFLKIAQALEKEDKKLQ